MIFTLPLVLIDDWGFGGKGDLIRADGEGIEDLVEVLPPEESVERLSELCNFYLYDSWMIFRIFSWPGFVFMPKAKASLSRKAS